MNKTATYALSVILFLIGIVMLIFGNYFGFLSLIGALIFVVMGAISQRKSDNKRSKEHRALADLIQAGKESRRKIESLRELMKQKNIDIKKIVTKFDKPLYSLFIYKFNEVSRGKKNMPKPLTELIVQKLKFKLIGNSFYMLLPKDMPTINSRFNLERWIKGNIISKLPEGTTYTLNFIALVDVRKIFCYKTVEWGNTVFDVLDYKFDT